MKSIDKIPTSKIQRASKLVSTGAKVGVNYLKYYGNKLTKGEEKAKQTLDSDNAEDIYNSLKQLKGSALKVAQMLSMEKGILPEAYVEQFSLSQFSVPPLSAPLVSKTFKKYFGKRPEDLFDKFDYNAVNGASIGQVHLAEKDGKKLAVKIQYPGVAESISSDLAMVKPIALKILNIDKKESEKYFKEVEEKLLEETDYVRELQQSQEIAENCKDLPNVRFPNYYPELSCDKIITMDWMEGIHLSEFTKAGFDKENGNKLGQTLWDFYMYQIHVLKKVHADPHPGNFLVSKNMDLIALDFGCMKEIPEDFYKPYFDLALSDNFNNEAYFEQTLYQLDILKEDDTPEDIVFFKEMFHEMLSLFTQPINQDIFDFSNEAFFGKISDLGMKMAKNKDLRGKNADRGSKHFIYINRTLFGLFNLMHDLKASGVKTGNYSDSGVLV
jgi:predicted unusual protein kinase regulating ubiquinone biosynthesis (AarF/ABC1/UbiB family)